jgi:FkbM family methyltransferase
MEMIKLVNNYIYLFLFTILVLFYFFFSKNNNNNIQICPNSIISSSSTKAGQAIKNNKETNDISSDLFWREIFEVSEEQKLIDKKTLFKSFKYMIQETNENDPELIEFVKSIIIPPSNKPLNLDIKNKNDYSQYGQSIIIDEILKSKRNGFIVEAGAFDGEIESNSLFFEINRNWSGILIEPIPTHFQKILSKNRHIHKINACIAKNKPIVAKFAIDRTASSRNELANDLNKFNRFVPIRHGKDRIFVYVPCFSLNKILNALNVKQVDYFSLDVEGSEMDVLNNIDFNTTNFKTFTVEHFFLSHPALIDFMKQRCLNYVAKGVADHFFSKN